MSSFKFGNRDLYDLYIYTLNTLKTQSAHSDGLLAIALRMCLLELLAAIPEEAANRKAQCRPMSCCDQVSSTYLQSDHSRGSNDLARSNLHQVMVGAERRASFAASMLGSPAYVGL